jgi:UDP-3-O-[3-hydroxymyristoyl] glucosamine N-acyltransferase
MLNLTVAEIAELLNGEVIGDSAIKIIDIKPIEHAGGNELSFYYHEKYEEYFKNSQASCLIISNTNNTLPRPNQAFIRVEKPYLSFVNLLKYIEATNPKAKSGIHPSAMIDDGCEIGGNVHIGANCVIGSHTTLSDGVVLKPGAILYENVKVGSNSVINSNAVIYQNVEIGKRCIIHAGAVIGSDGFGYVENPADGSFDKVPQLGNVIIEDDVEIGSNTTIDCA